VELEHNDDDDADDDQTEDLEATMRSLQKASLTGREIQAAWSAVLGLPFQMDLYSDSVPSAQTQCLQLVVKLERCMLGHDL
jgi:hypothetical protein